MNYWSVFPIGKNCEKDVDECESWPCIPGVECINVFGSYHCGPCPKGFHGDGNTCHGKSPGLLLCFVLHLTNSGHLIALSSTHLFFQYLCIILHGEVDAQHTEVCHVCPPLNRSPCGTEKRDEELRGAKKTFCVFW